MATWHVMIWLSLLDQSAQLCQDPLGLLTAFHILPLLFDSLVLDLLHTHVSHLKLLHGLRLHDFGLATAFRKLLHHKLLHLILKLHHVLRCHLRQLLQDLLAIHHALLLRPTLLLLPSLLLLSLLQQLLLLQLLLHLLLLHLLGVPESSPVNTHLAITATP